MAESVRGSERTRGVRAEGGKGREGREGGEGGEEGKGGEGQPTRHRGRTSAVFESGAGRGSLLSAWPISLNAAWLIA